MLEQTPRRIGFGDAAPVPAPVPNTGPETSEVCDFFAGDWVVAVQADLLKRKALKPEDVTGVFDDATCVAYREAYAELPTAVNLVARYVPPDHLCMSVRTGCLAMPEPPTMRSNAATFVASFSAMLLVMGAVVWFTRGKKR